MRTILALDISSSWLGWAYLHPERRPIAKSIALGAKSDIAERCAKAAREVGLLIAACGDIDCVAIEAPVAQYASAVIAQCRVAGAVLAELAAHNLAWCEVSPAAAKRALAGAGNAQKRDMLAAAAPLRGHDPLFLEIESRRGLWAAWMNDYCVFDEHAADALGIALASMGKAVEVVR
jgi:Holliday junction resolvasome RuvABC endonuclease subunit